jgi:hypothetical protein
MLGACDAGFRHAMPPTSARPLTQDRRFRRLNGSADLPRSSRRTIVTVSVDILRRDRCAKGLPDRCATGQGKGQGRDEECDWASTGARKSCAPDPETNRARFGHEMSLRPARNGFPPSVRPCPSSSTRRPIFPAAGRGIGRSAQDRSEPCAPKLLCARTRRRHGFVHTVRHRRNGCPIRCGSAIAVSCGADR